MQSKACLALFWWWIENKWQVHIQSQQVQWAVNHQGAEQTQLLNPSVGKAPKWLEYKKDGFEENTESSLINTHSSQKQTYLWDVMPEEAASQ